MVKDSELLGVKKRRYGFYLRIDTTGKSTFSAYGATKFVGNFKIDLAKNQIVFKSSDDQPNKTAHILYLDPQFMQFYFDDAKDHIHVYVKRK